MSRRKAKRCKYGKLKHKVGRRVCRKAPVRRKHKHTAKAASVPGSSRKMTWAERSGLRKPNWSQLGRRR